MDRSTIFRSAGVGLKVSRWLGISRLYIKVKLDYNERRSERAKV